MEEVTEQAQQQDAASFMNQANQLLNQAFNEQPINLNDDPIVKAIKGPMPYNVIVERIPRTLDIKQIWRQGIQQIEQIFSEHILRMNDQFEQRSYEYDNIRDQLVANHDFLKRHYDEMTSKLLQKQQQIQAERDQFEKDKKDIADLVKLDSEVIPINVGGTHHMMTERDVLRLVPGSTLEKMFSGLHELKKIDDQVFLDRDGRTFQYLVNYLRNKREVLPEFLDPNDEINFYKELDFWKIPTKQNALKKRNVTSPASISIQQVQMQPPQKMQTPLSLLSQKHNEDPYSDARSEDSQGVALKAAKEKWNELGPLRLEDIVKNSVEPIDQSKTFGQSSYNKYIIGQLGPNGKVTGVGKEINHIIYEGQFKNDVYNGYGRFIYSNGNYYIGNWLDGKRSGYGKLVDKSGRVYEGQWQYSKFMGDQ